MNTYNEYNRKIEDAKKGTVSGSLTNYQGAITPQTTQGGSVVKTKVGDINTDW